MATPAMDMAQIVLTAFDTSMSKFWREEDRRWRAKDRKWRVEEMEYRAEERKWRDEEKLMRETEQRLAQQAVRAEVTWSSASSGGLSGF